MLQSCRVCGSGHGLCVCVYFFHISSACRLCLSFNHLSVCLRIVKCFSKSSHKLANSKATGEKRSARCEVKPDACPPDLKWHEGQADVDRSFAKSQYLPDGAELWRCSRRANSPNVETTPEEGFEFRRPQQKACSGFGLISSYESHGSN